ncbi:hypothetical protein HDV00_011095 [Rhizophlyctis rosea]|nr:hypothetical protein HDV00_011095 [Rhizophlyctis rosea]
MEAQLEELFSFLKDPRIDVRQLAVKNVAGLTASPEFLPYFKRNGCAVVKDLMACRKGEPLTAHDAISALINISSDPIVQSVMNDEDFLYDVILGIVLPREVIADLYCMLLNNLSENGSIVRRLIPLETPAVTATPQSTPSPADPHQPTKPAPTHQFDRLDGLLEVFNRGADKKYNPAASFHFLAGVFANVATTRQGAQFLRGKSPADNMVRLSKIAVFMEHEDKIRRSGAISTVKNCAFDVEGHDILLFDEELNLLPYILLPLSGPEDYTDEEMEGMPDELQLLEGDKKRETDPKLRVKLLETLLLLATTRKGRDYMRVKKVYPVIQKLHLSERNDEVKEVIERLVNMLMRDEAGGEQASKGAQPAIEGGKDLRIEEVVDSDSEDEEDIRIEEII